ncbi:MAG: hypothetical protein MRQ09_00005, partial [Candidatus Midichloria sp.]|nr:hypothetical protein [Candidatus Midichloria sp.]
FLKPYQIIPLKLTSNWFFNGNSTLDYEFQYRPLEMLGDGLDDLIVGAHAANPGGRPNAGQAYVIFGAYSFTSPLELSSLNGSNGFVINGIAASDYTGQAVSSAGDVNGDGFNDFMLGRGDRAGPGW